MSLTLIEKGQLIKEKREEAVKIVTEAPKGKDPDGKESPKLTNDQFAKLAEIREFLDKETPEFEAAKMAEKGFAELWNEDGPITRISGHEPQGKSIFQLIAETASKATVNGASVPVDTGYKSLVSNAGTSGSGIIPYNIRRPGVLDLSEVKPTPALELIPQGETGVTNSISYLRDVTAVNGADVVAEGATKPDATVIFDEILSPVRTIAVTIDVTKQQLEDIPSMMSLLQTRLSKMTMGKTEQQSYKGTGSGQQLTGLMNTTGVQTVALGSDTLIQRILTALGLVAASSNDSSITPNGIVLRTAQWYTDIRGLRDSQGRYIIGDPQDTTAPRLWGVPVTPSNVMVANEFIVGDFDYCELLWRHGIEVAVSDSHGTNFKENKYTVRVELRAAFNVYRPASFAKGLTS